MTDYPEVDRYPDVETRSTRFLVLRFGELGRAAAHMLLDAGRFRLGVNVVDLAAITLFDHAAAELQRWS